MTQVKLGRLRANSYSLINEALKYGKGSSPADQRQLENDCLQYFQDIQGLTANVRFGALATDSQLTRNV